jgi:bacterioferritin-associated ferredoxin
MFMRERSNLPAWTALTGPQGSAAASSWAAHAATSPTVTDPTHSTCRHTLEAMRIVGLQQHHVDAGEQQQRVTAPSLQPCAGMQSQCLCCRALATAMAAAYLSAAFAGQLLSWTFSA